MLDFIIADAQDLSEISKVMSESFTTILNDFKDIMLYGPKLGLHFVLQKKCGMIRTRKLKIIRLKNMLHQ